MSVRERYAIIDDRANMSWPGQFKTTILRQLDVRRNPLASLWTSCNYTTCTSQTRLFHLLYISVIQRTRSAFEGEAALLTHEDGTSRAQRAAKRSETSSEHRD